MTTWAFETTFSPVFGAKPNDASQIDSKDKLNFRVSPFQEWKFKIFLMRLLKRTWAKMEKAINDSYL
jgi:hypothetical protein